MLCFKKTNVVIKFIKDIFKPQPKLIYVVVLQMRRQRLYFKGILDGRPNFCTLRAGAWYFDSATEARDARHMIQGIDASYGELNIESFTKI
jgi:hypothetical protein